MTEARDDILGRLRATTDALAPVPLQQPVAAGKTATADGDANADSLSDSFRTALEAVHGEVHRVGGDWPRAVAERLAAARINQLWYGPYGRHGTQLQAGWPSPSAGIEAPDRVPRLVPFAAPIESCREALFAERGAGFTSALGAIAETGTLILQPGPTEPRTLSLVPEVHCVLLEQSRIFPTLEDWMAWRDWTDLADWTQDDRTADEPQRPERLRLPTNLLLITGPSKSADIEQTLTLGVHGPKRLMVFLMPGARATSEDTQP